MWIIHLRKCRNPQKISEPIFETFSTCLQGANSYGQLAQGHKEDQLLPQMVKNCPGRIRSIQGGGGHTGMLLGKMIVLDLGSPQIGLCSNDVMGHNMKCVCVYSK